MSEQDRVKRFERLALPHLNDAYNLARWLTRDAQDADDVVQEAYLRAFRYFDGFKGDKARPWLLSIVRRVAYDWLERNRPSTVVRLDEAFRDGEPEPASSSAAVQPLDPEAHLLRATELRELNQAIADLPTQFREILVLRELHELSYKDIADIAAIPIGTVMSRLARARRLLKEALTRRPPREAINGA
ncbi:MAG: sigma-70 family RNA polymerase sigma factor [Proteobacteria bacterium]|nr:sigma-70 family RNA polymerase sigma factor [Pseudomonadota bacterium]MBI3496180.1 sigma-70 family RNA polymerase sigma factor [Pseudomonadota bacterium]